MWRTTQPAREGREGSVWSYCFNGMVSNMKTTIDLPEALLREAQEAARAEGSTLRAFVGDGLRTVLERCRLAATFTLPDASVDGHGLRAEASGLTWEELRAETYGDRA